MIGSKKHTLITILLILISVFLLSACDEKDPLIATWENADSGITMQFKENGDLVIANQKISKAVTYERQDPNILLIKGSLDGSYPDQTMTYRIEEDRLILTYEGDEDVFTKVK